jgi:hypothetical protein
MAPYLMCMKHPMKSHWDWPKRSSRRVAGIGKGYSDLIYPVRRNDTISMHTHQGEGKMFSTHVLIGFLSIGF